MIEKAQKLPSVDHPITIEPMAGRVVVTVAGRPVADSSRTLMLREAAYPPVYYIPREDAEMSLLQRTTHATYCPYKGDCSYFSITGVGERGENAVWTYETPFEAVAAIKDHLAFYPNRVDAITLY